MNKTLVCEYDGEILAHGTARSVEEFIFVEIPAKDPEVMTPREFIQWINKQKHWRILE